jgi:mono/diheme cytochrome c family protein
MMTAFRLAVGMAAIFVASSSAARAETPVERGKYLVAIMGCTDCHTPGSFLGHPDPSRFLAGSDVGFAIPGEGVFVGRNLTPDIETGLGGWTKEQIVVALTTGNRPDGRMLAPAMPWNDFSHLTRTDAMAVAAYLKSLPPIRNEVPGPFGPDETPPTLVMTVVPGAAYAGMAKAPAASSSDK